MSYFARRRAARAQQPAQPATKALRDLGTALAPIPLALMLCACSSDPDSKAGASPGQGGSSATSGASEVPSTTAQGGTVATSNGRGGNSAISSLPQGGNSAISSSSGASGSSATQTTLMGGLGTHPADGGPATRGGTMTFLNVGADGWWPRRLDRDPSDPLCTVKSGTDTWGGPCCLAEQRSSSTSLSPFDAELTLLLKAVRVRQLAVYQPLAGKASDWSLVSSYDDRDGVSNNLWATQSGNGSDKFAGDLTHDDCVWYVTQRANFDCGNGRDYFCPNDPGVKHLGWSGSKLIVVLASMVFDDAGVKACGASGVGKPSPWIAIVASELTRDGGRKWNGLCNCYSKTGTVGDGCGEINLFEVVMDNNAYSNREFISTGLRSYQAGHVGGNVCGQTCTRTKFPSQEDVVDACATSGYTQGPSLTVGGKSEGCPVWVRPQGDRYLTVLLDADRRLIQIAMLHPNALPKTLGDLLPAMPANLARATIDVLADLRLPSGG